MARALTIAVTGLNATDNPGPGVGVLRSLAAAQIAGQRLVGLTYDALDPGLYCGELGLAASFLLPYPSQGSEPLLARLREIHAQLPIDVLIPTLDAELPAFIALEPALRALGIALCLPSRAQLDARAKPALAELGRAADVEVPRSETVHDVPGLCRALERLRLPVMVKGIFYGAQRASSLDEAIAAFHRTLAKWGGPVIVQEFHEGEEFDVVAVGDGAGALIGAVAMKKLYLTEQGKAWSGVTVRDEGLIDAARRIVAALKWRGPCEVEVLRTREGRYLLIEVNPRFPAWTYLATGAGQNLPQLVCQLARGERVAPQSDFKAGVMFVRIALDQLASIEDFQRIAAFGEQRAPTKPEAA